MGRDFVLGVYPMFQDETCFFLAVDFDREDWRKTSVLAGIATNRIVGKGPDGYREALEYLKERG